MSAPIRIGVSGPTALELLPAMSNRHGLITGATGTGKTVTLQVLAEGFSRLGVPVFLADVKGDLAGLGAAGATSPKLQERLAAHGLPAPEFRAAPAAFWDVFGKAGHPVRATVSDLGPQLLARMLELNETQAGVLALTFKIADDAGLLLLDFKDLRALLEHVGNNAKQFRTSYGNVAPASIGAIQRGLLQLETQGGEAFLGEPALDIADLLRTDGLGRGIVNVLAADRLLNSPRVYSTFLLWLLAELFERLPEVGDPEKPRLVFFFDEAHLLFAEAPKSLLEKIEQVVRLVRSKGVGVWFVTQNPLDIPETVLGQLGNRVQHALRAFTPRDQKAVRTAAETLRPNPLVDTVQAISELGVGEALVSFLDEKGRPRPVERAWIVPPGSRLGTLTEEERAKLIAASALQGKYDQTVDRESAYERLKGRATPAQPAVKPAPPAAEIAPRPPPAPPAGPPPPPLPPLRPREVVPDPRFDDLPPAPREPGVGDALSEVFFGRTGPRGGYHPGVVDSLARSAASTLGREITRGLLGSLFGGRGRR